MPKSSINAQSFSIDFEDENVSAIWKKYNFTADTSAYSGDFVYECQPHNLYAFGFNYDVDDSIENQNAIIIFDMMLRSDTLLKAVFVLDIKKDGKDILWKSYPLADENVTENEWYNKTISIKVPNDFLKDTHLNCYFLNHKKEHFYVDDFNFTMEYFDLPSYMGCYETQQYPASLNSISDTEHLNLLYSKKDKRLILSDHNFRILTKPLSLVNTFVYNNDTIDCQSDEWKFLNVKSFSEKDIYYFRTENDYYTSFLKIEFHNDSPNVDFNFDTEFKQSLNIIKSSLLMPFRDDDFKIYRRNPLIDTVDYQDVYYLDKEGFSLVYNDKQLNIYHPKKVSSIQLDTRNSHASINFDYYLDHPLAHYPLLDTSNFYIDRSATFVAKEDVLTSSFTISMTEISDLPRIMPIMEGYESGIIFTEHADWSDIRTHRATYFGSEDITDADSAVGGFVYYDIPVTKSVFYNNPDSVNNFDINQNFPGLHSTIMTDSLYFDFLEQLRDKGFDICLHTPEQYTSNRNNLFESLSFMREFFASPSWIDHGFNNSLINNREDMLCDGLDSLSEYYVYDLWKDNGVRYPWNGSYEEMMIYNHWFFDNQLLQPYPGFGDALPLPKVMTLRKYPDILLWFTSSTMEPNSNWAWNYFFSQDNLDKIVDFRAIYITHCYSPWVNAQRGYWEDIDGKIMAKKGMNESFQRIQNLEKQHLMLPLTIAEYMKYQQQLQNLDYRLNEDGSLMLKNNNEETIVGLSLICTEEMTTNKVFNIRKTKSADEWIIWFDLLPHEEITIFKVNDLNY